LERPATILFELLAHVTWLSQLEKSRTLIRAWARDQRPQPRELARIAPVLLDSVYRPDLLKALQTVTTDQARRHGGLAYVNGVLAAQNGDRTEATRWLTRALALTPEAHRALSARIGSELALVYLGGGDRVAADAVLAQIETREGVTRSPSAERLLLQGLLYKDIGDHHSAKPLYRQALARSKHAVTPITQVLALVNLAIALEHTSPSESLALCGLANELIDQERLDPRLRGNVWNVLGYTEVCAGNLTAGRAALNRAVEEADASGVAIYGLRARFNLTIVDELEGDLGSAEAGLRAIREIKGDDGSEPLAVWAAIRSAWIALERSDPLRASRDLEGPARKARCHWEAVETVRMRIAIIDGDFELARKLLVPLVAGYRGREDLLIAMTLLLWGARLEDAAGHTQRARRFLDEAWEIGSRHSFVVAPSWWSREIVASARSLAVGTRMATWVASLHAPMFGENRSLRQVVLTTGGDILLGGSSLGSSRWRGAGAGRRVLRRYLGLLVAAYPHWLPRDQVADALWPHSDGDRATSNLYAATSDLRCVLRGVDGVGLQCSDGAYGLTLQGNVTIRDADTETASFRSGG
jgi:tetratricopeptide (TPR) repeat protein